MRAWMLGWTVSIGLLAAGVAVNLAGCTPPDLAKLAAPTSLEKEAVAQELRNREADEAYRRGADALAHRDMVGAELAFARAVELNPYHGAAHNDLGMVYFKQGDLHKAATEFDAAAKNLPSTFEPHYNLGMVWEAAGDLHRAADAYASALHIAPDELGVAENLARIYVKMNSHPAEAIRLLENCLVRENRQEWRHWMQLALYKLKGSPSRAAPAQSQESDPDTSP